MDDQKGRSGKECSAGRDTTSRRTATRCATRAASALTPAISTPEHPGQNILPASCRNSGEADAAAIACASRACEKGQARKGCSAGQGTGSTVRPRHSGSSKRPRPQAAASSAHRCPTHAAPKSLCSLAAAGRLALWGALGIDLTKFQASYIYSILHPAPFLWGCSNKTLETADRQF